MNSYVGTTLVQFIGGICIAGIVSAASIQFNYPGSPGVQCKCNLHNNYITEQKPTMEAYVHRTCTKNNLFCCHITVSYVVCILLFVSLYQSQQFEIMFCFKHDASE